MCLRLCRFYPEDPSLADLAGGDPGIVPICIFVVLYRLLSGNVRVFACQSFFSFFSFRGEEGEDGRRRKLCSKGRKEKKKKDEMDEGSLGALGVLIIRRSVAGSELTIFPWLYPCLMI